MRRPLLALLAGLVLGSLAVVPLRGQIGAWVSQNNAQYYATTSSDPAVTIINNGTGPALALGGDESLDLDLNTTSNLGIYTSDTGLSTVHFSNIALWASRGETALDGATGLFGLGGSAGMFQAEGFVFGLSSIAYGTETFPATHFFAKSRSTDGGATDAIVADDDLVGLFQYRADDGTDMASTVASIGVYIDGTPAANDTPGRIEFSTTASGANSASLRMSILNDGQVSVESLKTTGSAGSKAVVCVDTTTGQLYASSTGTDCSN